MGCATGCVKYLVFLANLIFALAGLVLIIIGVVYKLQVREVTSQLPSDFGLAPIMCIVVGAIIFLTAFLGCCGAIKESPCMLTTFAIIMLTIFIIQVAIAVYGFLKIKNENELKTEIHNVLREPFSNYTKYHEQVDVQQAWLHCCGIDGPGSWRNETLPKSCCPENSPSCKIYDTIHYRESCTQGLYNLIIKSSIIVGGVVIGIAAIEVIGAIMTLCLASSIRNHYRRNIYA